jgi:anti-sigma factor RsiW
MRCDEAQELISVYLDGELDLVRNLELERHIKACPDCEPVRQDALQLRSAIRKEVPYFRAPQSLADRVRAAARQEARQTTPRRTAPRPAMPYWQWIGAAAVVALLILVTVKLKGTWTGPSHDQLLAQEIYDAHVRSLMADHLMDVPSTDQHTVKPWFDGKLDFAPPVMDLAQDGFPLIGGRLDYLDNHPVATMVYHRRLHVINLFVWPSTDTGDRELALEVRQGYNILHWTKGGMEFWAVSDVSAGDLQTFAGLLRK